MWHSDPMGVPADSDAIVLAGGRSVRFGGDKIAARLGDRAVLDWVLDAVRTCAAVVVAGPPRPTGRPVRFVTEEPPFGGPLAGVAAAIVHVERPLVWLVAGDQPLFAGAMPALRQAIEAAPAADACLLTDRDGRRRYLSALWRTEALRRRIRATTPHDGGPARVLYDDVKSIEVVDAGDWSADCDTAADLERLRLHVATTGLRPGATGPPIRA